MTDWKIVVEAVMVSSMNNNGALPLVVVLDSVRAKLYSSPEGSKHFKRVKTSRTVIVS